MKKNIQPPPPPKKKNKLSWLMKPKSAKKNYSKRKKTQNSQIPMVHECQI